MWKPLSRLSRVIPLWLCAAALLPMSNAVSAAAPEKALRVVGAGASFPAPLYHRWFRDYFKTHPGVQFDYQSIGSGGGIEKFRMGLLDFAGSDLPLAKEELAEIEGGAIQFPMTGGAVVLTYNLPGIDTLKLSRNTVAGIFLGKIKRWNDAAIVADNPGTTLPDTLITVVVRADASGTTYVTTRHLAAISKEFDQQVGKSMSPNWPKILKKRGALIKGHGNGGVAALTQAVPGAIGYVQYSYAHLTGMAMATLQNQAGEFVAPNSESFLAAVASFRSKLDPKADDISDPIAADAYPILALSWLLMRKEYKDPRKVEALQNILRYCLTEGQKVSAKLGYIPFRTDSAEKIFDRVEAMK